MGKNLMDWVYTPAAKTVRPHWLNWIWVVVFLCQVGQGMLYWTWSGPDRNRQLVAAKMAVEGHGLSEPFLDSATGELIYEPLVSWAPGYSRLATILYPIFDNWGMVSQVISILAIILVFAGLRWLFFQIKNWFPWKGEFFLLILWAFSFTPFRHFTDTDMLSLGAALLASGFLLRNRQWDWLVAVALLFLAAWFRIAYVPFMVIPVCWLWWNSSSWRLNPRVILAGVVSGIGMLSYGWLFSPSHPVSGGVGEMLSFGIFFPENLLSWDAFPVKSWIYISAEGVANKFGPTISLLVSGALIVFSVTFFYRLGIHALRKGRGHVSSSLTMLLVLVMSVTCLVLGWLSLRTPEEIHDGMRTWTYVQETRYYGWTLLLIETWTVGLFFRAVSQEFTRTILRISLLLALGLGTMHGLYRHSSAMFFSQHIGTRYAESEQELVSIMEQVETLSGNGPIYLIPGVDIYSRDQVSLGILTGGVLAYSKEGIPSDSQVIDLRAAN